MYKSGILRLFDDLGVTFQYYNCLFLKDQSDAFLRLGGLFMITATLFDLLTILLRSIAPTFWSRDTFYFFLVAIFWRSQFLWSRALFKVWGFFKDQDRTYILFALIFQAQPIIFTQDQDFVLAFLSLSIATPFFTFSSNPPTY